MNRSAFRRYATAFSSFLLIFGLTGLLSVSALGMREKLDLEGAFSSVVRTETVATEVFFTEEEGGTSETLPMSPVSTGQPSDSEDTQAPSDTTAIEKPATTPVAGTTATENPITTSATGTTASGKPVTTTAVGTTATEKITGTTTTASSKVTTVTSPTTVTSIREPNLSLSTDPVPTVVTDGGNRYPEQIGSEDEGFADLSETTASNASGNSNRMSSDSDGSAVGRVAAICGILAGLSVISLAILKHFE